LSLDINEKFLKDNRYIANCMAARSLSFYNVCKVEWIFDRQDVL